jgi:hypothetical protein
MCSYSPHFDAKANKKAYIYFAYSGFLHKIQYIGVNIPVSAAPTKASAPLCSISLSFKKKKSYISFMKRNGTEIDILIID